MRYLRLLTNALTGGVLGAAYLAVLILQLNPQVPLASMTAVRWFGALLGSYGLFFSIAIYALVLVREALASRPLAPGWLSVRLLGWVGAASAAAAAFITWANLRGFRAVLSSEGPVSALERLRQGATATTVLAALLLLVVLLRYSFGRRGTPATALLLIATMALSVAVPLGLRGPGDVAVPTPGGPAGLSEPRPNVAASFAGPRIRLLLLDGASLDLIRQRVAAGQLPNFANMLDRGATIDLATLKPTQADPIWAAAATGKYPPKTGIRSNAIYRVRTDDTNPVDLLPDYCFASALAHERFVTQEFLSSAALRARPFWDILADYGLASGIVNWPLTSPVHAQRGYVISDRFDEGASEPLRLSDANNAWPTTAAEIARETFDAWQFRSWQDVLPAASQDEAEPSGLRVARWDRAYSLAASELERALPPRVTAVRYEGLDAFGHLYLNAAQPELFGLNLTRSARRSVLDRYYAYIDDEIGGAIRQLEPGDLLLVVSGFGLQPETLTKRLFARALNPPEIFGSHERAPDGFLLAFGTNVVANQTLPRGAIVDVAPTVLYYLGLQVGRDMDGFARVDLFQRSYAIDHPVMYRASNER